MWAVFATALLAALRGRLRLRLVVWRLCHIILAVVIILGSVVDRRDVGMVSKAAVSALVLAAVAKVIIDLRLLADNRRMAGRDGHRAMR